MILAGTSKQNQTNKLQHKHT